jgi:hypothetical protein
MKRFTVITVTREQLAWMGTLNAMLRYFEISFSMKDEWETVALEGNSK